MSYWLSRWQVGIRELHGVRGWKSGGEHRHRELHPVRQRKEGQQRSQSMPRLSCGQVLTDGRGGLRELHRGLLQRFGVNVVHRLRVGVLAAEGRAKRV